MCPQCGFDWTLTEAVALDLVSPAPSLYSRALAGREGARHGAGGSWSPREYLWHVVDVLRHVTENLWMLAVDLDAGFAPWREHDVMAARSPSPMSMRVGLWALAVAAGDWARAACGAPGGVWAWDRDDGWTDRGHALRWAAHEVVHHENDVRWGLS